MEVRVLLSSVTCRDTPLLDVSGDSPHCLFANKESAGCVPNDGAGRQPERAF